jgi:hypothetical protein
LIIALQNRVKSALKRDRSQAGLVVEGRISYLIPVDFDFGQALTSDRELKGLDLIVSRVTGLSLILSRLKMFKLEFPVGLWMLNSDYLAMSGLKESTVASDRRRVRPLDIEFELFWYERPDCPA